MTQASDSVILERAKIALKKAIAGHLQNRRYRLSQAEYYRVHLDEPSDQCLVIMAKDAYRNPMPDKAEYAVLVAEYNGVSMDSGFQNNYKDRITTFHPNLDEAFDEFWRHMEKTNPGYPY